MNQKHTKTSTPRNAWLSALTAHPPKQILALAEDVARRYEVIPKTIPQAGLTMLRMQESVFGEEFYLGELPFASAWVELLLPNGERVEGAAQAMSDSVDLAVALAICDAVLAHRLDGCARVAGAVEAGMQLRGAEQRKRTMMLAKTSVNFNTLSDQRTDDAPAN